MGIEEKAQRPLFGELEEEIERPELFERAPGGFALRLDLLGESLRVGAQDPELTVDDERVVFHQARRIGPP